MPDWINLLVVSSCSIAVVLLCFVGARRLHKPIDLGTEQGFLDAMLTIVGTLVSIVLGLLVAASLDRYQRFTDAVDSESRAVSDVFRLSRAMPKVEKEEIQTLCLKYCQAVISDEWPSLNKNEASVELYILYGDLLDKVLACKPQTAAETNIHQCMLTAVLEIGDFRRARLLAINGNWMTVLTPVLIFSAITVLFFAYLYMKQGSRLHLLLVGVVTLCLASNIGLIIILNSPFSGPLRIQPRSFQYNIELLTKVLKQMDTGKEQDHTGVKMPIMP